MNNESDAAAVAAQLRAWALQMRKEDYPTSNEDAKLLEDAAALVERGTPGRKPKRKS
jgi:hypothetical protein